MKHSTVRYILFAVIFSLLPCFGTFAQNVPIGIKLGITAADATLVSPYDGRRQPTSSRISTIAGLFLNANIGSGLLFRPGAELIGKGATEGTGYSYPVILHYLDFPVNILYKKRHLLWGGGPFVGIPLPKRYEDYDQPTEYGLNAQIGYELDIGASFNLNYSYGLSKFHNRYLGIFLGYTF